MYVFFIGVKKNYRLDSPDRSKLPCSADGGKMVVKKHKVPLQIKKELIAQNHTRNSEIYHNSEDVIGSSNKGPCCNSRVNFVFM